MAYTSRLVERIVEDFACGFDETHDPEAFLLSSVFRFVTYIFVIAGSVLISRLPVVCHQGYNLYTLPLAHAVPDRSFPINQKYASTAMASLSYAQTSSSSSSPRIRPVGDVKPDDGSEVESGYGSADSSTVSLPQVSLTPNHLAHLNAQLENMHPVDILRFSRIFFPNLYQSTAFGLTGLATMDMLSKLTAADPTSRSTDLIFLDTLYHFPETYALVERVQQRYPNIRVHTFRPEGMDTVADFEATYGEKLYDLSAEMYDWLAKVEPLQRAYSELNVAAVLTGRRRSQGGARDKMQVIEIDEERGVIKINPMLNWSFKQVNEYIKENNVPYNELLDRGYKSVGDWHSTSPVAEGEDERAGRWKGQAKTECGIHNKQSRYAEFLKNSERKQQSVQLDSKLSQIEQGQLPLEVS
jgi:phosphoadenosine phosphosulfate reductase